METSRGQPIAADYTTSTMKCGQIFQYKLSLSFEEYKAK
jgi:hypothetical protein